MLMPRIARTTPKNRINLELPSEVKSRLEALRETTNADSLSEVIRRSLAVYDFLWQEKVKGASTFIRSEDGYEQLVVLL